jgi:hypothetical protein
VEIKRPECKRFEKAMLAIVYTVSKKRTEMSRKNGKIMKLLIHLHEFQFAKMTSAIPYLFSWFHDNGEFLLKFGQLVAGHIVQACD